MSKKNYIDSCDTLSDHVKQTVLNHPETEGLQSAAIFTKKVIQFIKDQCIITDNTHPILVLTPTVSGCFDTALLLNKVMPPNQIQTIYPHTIEQVLPPTTMLIVAPVIMLQLDTVFMNYALSASCVFYVDDDTPTKLTESILAPYLKQLPLDGRIIHLKGINTEVTASQTPSIIVTVEDELPIELTPVTKEKMQDSGDTNSENGHHIVLVERNYKRAYLRNRLRGSDKKTIIITRTRHNAHRLEEYLYQGKVRSRILHANLSDEAKEKVIERFQSDDLSVLLLPESIAQTIKLDNVDDIIFFDLPDVGVEFKNRVIENGAHFNVSNTSSIVTNDETPWIDAMEEGLQWILPKIQANAPQRSHNILRIRDRNQEKTEKRSTTRGLRKTGKNNQKKRPSNQFSQKPQQTRAQSPKQDQQPASYQSDDPFNSNNQPIVNENRNPFASDSFEANAARQNKKRVRQFFTRKEAPQREARDDFNSQQGAPKKDVKVVHKKRRSFDVDGNQ